jgi:SAM-dependent methyltransferase
VSADFDAYADAYREAVQGSIDFCGQDLDQFTRRKADHLVDLAARRLGEPERLRVLDVGCGVGETDRFLAGRFGELHGVDMAPGAVERAVRRNPSVRYRSYEGRRLPYEGGSFDLAFAICVMHHVPPPDRADFAAELARVVRPGGVVAIFEHNPLNPLTRVAVSRCEFDADAALLTRRSAGRLLRDAGLRRAEERYIIFLPFQRRRTRVLERALARVPAGAQYYVAAAAP